MKFFQHKSIALVAGFVLTFFVGVSVWPASAGPYITGTSAFGTARQLTRDMSSQARGMAKLLAKIDLEFVEDVKEKIIEARDLIVTCGGPCAVEEHQASILIEQVISHLNDFLELKLELLLTDIEQLAEDAGSLEGKVDSLFANGKLQTSAYNNLDDKLTSVNSLLLSLRLEIESAQSLIEDGDEGETPLDASSADDILDWLEIFLDDPSDFTSLNEACDILLLILGYGTTDGDLDTALKKIIKPCPVGILPCLTQIDKVLKAEQRRNAYKPTGAALTKASTFSVLVSAEALRFVSSTRLDNSLLKLWDAQGHLVGVYEFDGTSLALPLTRVGAPRLANGVYYYAVAPKNDASRVAQSTVQKLVLIR
jgi:hypothetical protein